MHTVDGSGEDAGQAGKKAVLRPLGMRPCEDVARTRRQEPGCFLTLNVRPDGLRKGADPVNGRKLFAVLAPDKRPVRYLVGFRFHR